MKKFYLLFFLAAVGFVTGGCETMSGEVKASSVKSSLESANDVQTAVDEQEKEAVKVLDAAGEEINEVEALPAAEGNDSLETESESADKEMQAEVEAAGANENQESSGRLPEPKQ